MRHRFLDTARCLAIVMMVVAHVRDGLMSQEAAASGLARLHDHFRGYTAPLFFVVSGWSFAAATLPRWRDHRVWGAPLRARIERIAVLFALGRGLTLPWWHEGFPFDVPREVWLPFGTSGVLECLAVAMLAAHALVCLTSGPRRFVGWALVLAVAAVLGAATLQELASGLPLPLRGLFNSDGVGGGFPLAPFAAYFWVGAALGGVGFLTAATPRSVTVACGALATSALLAGLLLDPLFSGPRMAVASPSLFLDRCGWVLLTVSLLAAAHLVLPERLTLERLSKRALTYYVGHMLLLWGIPFVPGLVHRSQHGAGVAQVALVAAAVLVGLTVFCVATERQQAQTERGHASGG